MKIAVCGESDTFVTKTLEMLEVFFRKSHIPFQVFSHESGEDVLKHIKNGIHFDIILVNIDEIKEKIVKQIRLCDPSVLMIFFADLYDKLSFAFEVNAFHYITNPLHFQMFASILKRALQCCFKKKNNFKVEWKKQIQMLSLKQIVYIECFNRHIKIQTTTDSYESCQAFKDIMDTMMIAANFIRVHQSFLVNPCHIKAVEQNEILCTNNITVPISIRRKKEALEKFRTYISKFSIEA